MARFGWLTPDTPTGQTVCRRFRIPFEFNAAFTGAIEALAQVWNWEEFGDLTPEGAAAIAFEFVQAEEDCDMWGIGCIILWPSATPPDYLLPCDGSVVARASYPELWEVWPAAYKSETSITLPDMRDRFALGAGTGNPWDTGGEASVTLTPGQMPAHTHSIANGYGPDVVMGYLGELPAFVPAPTPETTTSSGSGEAHENRPPFWCGVWCVIASP
jgi:microcystin-dependent protein